MELEAGSDQPRLSLIPFDFLNQSAQFYQKWEHLAQLSNIDSLKLYFGEAQCFFYDFKHPESQSILIDKVQIGLPIKQSQSAYVMNPKMSAATTQLTQAAQMSNSKSESAIKPNKKLIETVKTELMSESSDNTLSTSKSVRFSDGKETPKSADRPLTAPTSPSTNGRLLSESVYEMTDALASAGSSNQTEQSQGSQLIGLTFAEPIEFVKCMEKLINSYQVVEKHLENIQKANKEFVEFEKQEVKLNAIKQTLESLTSALRTLIMHKRAILDMSSKDMAKKISKLITNLTRDHQEIVCKYKEKNAVYLQNSDKWTQFHKDFETIHAWLQRTYSKINELNGSELDNDKLQQIIKVSRFRKIGSLFFFLFIFFLRSKKEFNNLTNFRLLLERTNLKGHEILIRTNEQEGNRLAERLASINQQWKDMVSMLNKLKEKCVFLRFFFLTR